MSPLRVLRGFLFGGIGGLIGFLLIEFLPPPFPSPPFRQFMIEDMIRRTQGALPPVSGEQQGLMGLILGMSIGGLLGLSEGIAEGNAAKLKRTFLWFLGL